jgi:hypothetical protein
MALKSPAEFYPQLTDERLSYVAQALLEVRHTTLQEMQSPFDDRYTREGTIFGRQRNMLIDMALRGPHDWLSLKHPGMDVTFAIKGVPCRFFTDDPDAPHKDGFFKRNAVDDLFEQDDDMPVMWRFVVDPAITEDDEDRVLCIGFNVFQEKVSEWVYRNAPPALHSVDNDAPPSVDLGPVSVDVRDDDAEAQPKSDEK